MNDKNLKITLKPGKDRAVRQRHPWIFRGAVAGIPAGTIPGQTAALYSTDGEFLARASVSPASQIALRIWSFREEDVIDKDWFREKIKTSIERRSELLRSGVTDAVRLVYSESDGLPGFIADLYGDFLVLQFLSAGAEYHRDLLIGLMQELIQPAGIWERSDTDARRKEGLPPVNAHLSGQEPSSPLLIQEHGLSIAVDIRKGHKTGFYLDQRDSRLAVRRYAEGKSTLNCFSYSGGFGLNALAAGAKEVIQADSSSDALELTQRNISDNGFLGRNHETVQADVFRLLRRFRDEERKFGLIILDPPKFVENRAHLDRGLRGYKDINWLAFRLLEPGGTLMTFSCSGAVDPELFRKVIAGAAQDAQRDVQILAQTQQSADHPVRLAFPEAAYLKGLICRALD